MIGFETSHVWKALSIAPTTQNFEFVLQMVKDLVYNGSVFGHLDDLHLNMTVGPKQGIRFVDEFNHGSPGFFSLLDPITLGIFFTCIPLQSLIRQ